MPLKSHHYTFYNGCAIQTLHPSEAKNIKPACCMNILLNETCLCMPCPAIRTPLIPSETQSLPECILRDTNIQVLRLTKQPCERDNRGILLTILDCRMHVDWKSDSVPLCCHAGVSVLCVCLLNNCRVCNANLCMGRMGGRTSWAKVILRPEHSEYRPVQTVMYYVSWTGGCILSTIVIFLNGHFLQTNALKGQYFYLKFGWNVIE